MSALAIRSILLSTAFALASCGGGGGGSHVASIPPPPPSPPPTEPPPPAIIPAATTSQQFAASGPGSAADQLQVRYVASSNSYEVQLPHSEDWVAVSYSPSSSPVPALINYTGGATLWLRNQGYRYSRLMEWAGGDYGGYEAIGMATPTSGVPVTGSADYSGQILGHTSEDHSPDDMSILGSISLAFNFGSGTLSGSVSPIVQRDFAQFPLGTTNFKDTVYSTGHTTFSGRFDTDLAGINSFSGLFTGPGAQELIGNFAFPYQSPIDGQTYHADGAFIGKTH